MDNKKALKKYIYERDIKQCRFCNKELEFRQISLDHYLPRSKKGPNDVFNIVLSCKKCNKYKENRVPSNYEEVLLDNFKQGVMDKKIKSSVIKLKHQDLLKIAETMNKIESIHTYTVFQGAKYRLYVRKDNVFKIIELSHVNQEKNQS